MLTSLVGAKMCIRGCGIIVDEFTRTEDPAILAIGDCTRHRNLFFEKMQRLESVANAVDQARTAAATLMGEEKPSPIRAAAAVRA